MSAAFDIVPRPDWASTTIVAIPHDATGDAAAWAREIFDLRSLPIWVKALGGVRMAVATALRLTPANPNMLAVDHMVDDEAVIDTDDVHLHFAAGVQVDPAAGLLYVTTAVALKGWRGRLYFVPVRFLHDAVTRSMIESAVGRLTDHAAA